MVHEEGWFEPTGGVAGDGGGRELGLGKSDACYSMVAEICLPSANPRSRVQLAEPGLVQGPSALAVLQIV